LILILSEKIIKWNGEFTHNSIVIGLLHSNIQGRDLVEGNSKMSNNLKGKSVIRFFEEEEKNKRRTLFFKRDFNRGQVVPLGR